MVSVIIASYNLEKNDWIHRCLNSLRNSTSDCNIIVVDNNSSDNTVGIIKEEYPEVTLLEQTGNLHVLQQLVVGRDGHGAGGGYGKRISQGPQT